MQIYTTIIPQCMFHYFLLLSSNFSITRRYHSACLETKIFDDTLFDDDFQRIEGPAAAKEVSRETEQVIVFGWWHKITLYAE